MAVTFDATATSKVANATSLTFSHTCSGSNRVMIVASSTDAGVNTTDITYAAVALTEINGISDNFLGLANRSEQWGKIAPATGANNVVITVASSCGIVGGSVSVNGADQSTGWHNSATANGNSTAPSVNVTSAAGELVVDQMANGVGATDLPTATVGAGQTQRWNDDNNNENRGCGSTEGGAATVTMSWTLSASELWTICSVAILASASTFVGDEDGVFMQTVSFW